MHQQSLFLLKFFFQMMKWHNTAIEAMEGLSFLIMNEILKHKEEQ